MVWVIVIAGVILLLLAVIVIGALLAEGSGKQAAIVAGVAIVTGLIAFDSVWDRPRPHWLTRSTAATAILSTAEFQHGTKLYLEIAEVEGVFPGACHNFRFAPEKKTIWDGYRMSGALKFDPRSDPTESTPEGFPESFGSRDLSDAGWLIDDVKRCAPHAAVPEIGFYELMLGTPIVEVNGIFSESSDSAKVDFIWYFQSLNQVGRSLDMVRGRKEYIESQKNLTPEEKAKAPFWNGSAELRRFDDGWRVTAIRGLSPNDLTLMMNTSWPYGPQTWPDPDFNWGAFDEDENH